MRNHHFKKPLLACLHKGAGKLQSDNINLVFPPTSVHFAIVKILMKSAGNGTTLLLDTFLCPGIGLLLPRLTICRILFFFLFNWNCPLVQHGSVAE